MSAIPIVLCSILDRKNTLLHNILVLLLVVYILVGTNILRNHICISIFAHFSKFVSFVNIPKLYCLFVFRFKFVAQKYI